MSPLIQRPDVALKLRDRYGLTSMPDSILAPELVPVVIIDDLSTSGPSRQCSGRVTQGAVAGEFSKVGLGHTDPPSNVTLIIRRIFLRVSVAGTQVHIGRLNQSVPGWVYVTTKGFRDFGMPGQPSAGITSDSDPALPSRMTIAVITTFDTGSHPYDTEIIIRPSDPALVVVANTANVSLDCSFDWEEIAPF